MRMILFAMILLTALNACSKSDDNMDPDSGSIKRGVYNGTLAVESERIKEDIAILKKEN